MNTAEDTFLIHLGDRLAGLRLAHNLTQAQLAEQAGVGLRTVQRLESGEAATQLSGFVRVCRVLGLLDQLDALIPEPTASPMAQLKLQGRLRQRSSCIHCTTIWSRGTKRSRSDCSTRFA